MVADVARAAAEGSYDVNDLLHRICETLARDFELDDVALGRFFPESGELAFQAAHGLPTDQLPQRVRVGDEPVLARAVEEGRPVLVEDVDDDAPVGTELLDLFGGRSVVVVPLVLEGRCLGIIAADWGGTLYQLGKAAFEVLTTIGTLTAVFLARALEHDELRRVGELKGNFIALASHELRTPAAVIHGIASTLHFRADQLRDEQLAELRSTLYEQTERMSRLVDQLLDLSRLEASAIPIRPERIPVRSRVEELVALQGRERARDVVVDVPPELEASVDPAAFDRIVGNLVANAFRYGRPPIRIAAEQRDRHFRLMVEDRGPGVPREFVPQLFERFSRSDEARAKSGGAGLGLAIAKSYAHAHGGEILYEPAEPRGARFEVVLPRA